MRPHRSILFDFVYEPQVIPLIMILGKCFRNNMSLFRRAIAPTSRGSVPRFQSGGRALIAASVVIAVLLGLLFTGMAWASPRSWQPVILRGAQTAALLGRPIEGLEVLARRAGALRPIPFQVDQRSPDGRFVLLDGPEPTTTGSRRDLEPDDEIAMMLSDLGTRCDLACHLSDNAVEIEVLDPLDEERRYAYMIWIRSPALNSTRYVEYDPARNQVETEHYRMKFSSGFPIDFALQEHLHEERPNMIRGFEVRAQSRFLWAFAIRIENRDVRNDVLAYKAGPIRIIRRVRHTMRLSFGLHSPGVVSNDTFYRDLIALPFTTWIPWVPRLLFADVRVWLYLNLLDLKGDELFCSGPGGCPMVVGDPAAERRLSAASSLPRADWIVINAKSGLLAQTFVPTPDLGLIDRYLYYRDLAHGETAAGSEVACGSLLTGWERLSPGNHRFEPLMIALPGAHDADALVKELNTAPVDGVRAARNQRRVSRAPHRHGSVSRAAARDSSEAIHARLSLLTGGPAKPRHQVIEGLQKR